MIQAANVGIGIEGKVCLQRVVHTVYVVVCSEVCCMVVCSDVWWCVVRCAVWWCVVRCSGVWWCVVVCS